MFGDFLTLIDGPAREPGGEDPLHVRRRWSVPLVLRTTLGATRRSAAQHQPVLHAWVSHIPGLKVALPATPYDAKGLLKAAIRDDNPVVFFEDKMMFATGAGPGGRVRHPARRRGREARRRRT